MCNVVATQASKALLDVVLLFLRQRCAFSNVHILHAMISTCILKAEPPDCHARRAGLWEFPSQPAAAGASEWERAAALDAYLARLLPGVALGGAALLERRSLGEVVHIFSHIRMTICVERRVVQVPPHGCACACVYYVRSATCSAASE